MPQIDTARFEGKLKETGDPELFEALARTILWLRLANLAALAHDLIVAELKKLKADS